MPEREEYPVFGWARNVLYLVHELHNQGYQRLRIAPGMSASGIYWRCTITHAGNISRGHGAMLDEQDGLVARYTTGMENRYFDWTDAEEDNASELAQKFLERFPELCQKSLGKDEQYVRWYQTMLEFAERNQFPVAYADWYDAPPNYLAKDEFGELPFPYPPVPEEERPR